ncbi:hypothetical protein BJ944DRAFT_270889 [Cunninghamella echinulata]|nr:hypothetical protein BJ944DRAFT_270889 [Cunninghamella echinulata]
MTDIEKPEMTTISKNQLSIEKVDNNNVPDRYFTPQPPPRRTSTVYTQNYTPTPNPETVTVHSQNIVSNKDPWCIGCLFACFLCCAVKNES